MPLFVSHRRLKRHKSFRRATAPWALDSGGFTELSQYGRWTVSAPEYVDAVRLYEAQIGRLIWAAPQDWMCEPSILAMTGCTVQQHQRRTVENFCELRSLAPDIAFAPVLQGWTGNDYERCAVMYADAGVDLSEEYTVGVGSVCRRQHTDEIAAIMRPFAEDGLSLHGFGVKKAGLLKYGKYLRSSDSMAWSYAARRRERLPGCTHKKCQNCALYALRWRKELLDELRHAQIIAGKEET